MNIINDTSSQTVITSLPTITGIFNPFITSNDLYTNFYTQIQTNNLLNTKQDTLTSSTVLLGNGGSITAINWNNITTNKPTNFQADWNTTIINRPDIYTKTETNNLLNAKENVLTFSAPLTRTTNTIGINLNSYPSFTVLNSCNYITNIALINYPTYNVLNTCNYITNSTNGLINYPSFTVLNSCNYIRNTALINYPTYNVLNTCNYITNSTNGLINYPSFTVLNSSNFITSNTAYNTYLRLDGAVSMTNKLLLLTGGNGNPSFATNNGGAGDRIIFESGVAGTTPPYSIGYSLNNLWISAPNTATINTYIGGNIKWSVGSTGALLYGTLNATTIQEGGSNLSSKYLSSASLSNYVLKAGDTITGTLTVNSNINISNSLIFDNSYNLKKIQLNSTNGFGSDGSSVTIYSSGGFAFRNSTLTTTLYSVDSAGSMSTNGTIYPGGGLNTIGTVTANSVVANSFTEGGVLLSNKYITSAALDTTYLRLNGANDMTGKLGIINSGLNTPQLGDYGGTGDRIILWKGGGGYPYSLGMNGNTMWYSVPNAIHNFYVNGTSRYQISSTGATLTGDLTVTGSITSGSTNNCFLGGLRINGSDTGNTLYNGTNSIGITALNSVHISTGTSLANYAQRLTVNTSGNVNITNSLSIDNKQIYDYLFNSTGFTHNSIGDFNNISSFGYRFIFNSTNGPGTQGTLNQFYSWYIGLGSEYSGSQYGCQFAIPRDITNPTLSIRFKEANNWKAWTGITANALKGTATFNVDYWHLSADGQKRLNFGNNGTTYFGTGGTTLAYVFRNPDDNSDIVKIDTNGSIRTIRALYCEGSFGLYLNVTTNNYWNIQSGVTPTGVVNSLLFYHLAIGINSVWWLSGTQTNTQADLSDKRSKYNIEDFTALETIEKLKPKSFDVIDDKDVKFQYGFIAQDIEEIPELKKLVFTEPNYVANINSYGTRRNDGNGCIITANDDLTGKIEVGDELKLVSDNNDKDNQEFILDATPYHNRYKRRYAKITEIISPTEFKVDCEINKLCCNDDDPFLIYGKKVEDAKSLDYNSFIALNTKAIQELYDIIKKQQEQINLLHEDYVRLLSKIQLE